MPLEWRGDDENNKKSGRDYTKQTWEAFGEELPENFDDQSPEDMIEEMRELGGEDLVQAAILMTAATHAYQDVLNHPGDDERIALFFALVEKMTGLGEKGLRNVIASGIVAIVNFKNTLKGE
jgi:hypothetical protein